ncbi:hypothetical protein [Geotoga petraea]|jgi:hypothetical protein|uniref:Uncharacterized protein n=1 Tax=Geotoga petraea TaxID=28234 RepID=A0A1G6MQB9_9BACT|nr:hypothetical protein [Geotoga petraea]MDK2946182.1 hypothetical protein [Geotoga sp.]TGG87382.1 hypothetical protein E4650_08755 [Geotoga petraea]SDC57712.1 hypothetical protein SAMN04488588_1343 [Geotoga petraea]
MFFENPFLSAFVQFAILGTLGEIAANILSKKKISILKTIGSIFVWGILGIAIKFVFSGFTGFVEHLTNIGYLPDGEFYNAFFKSVFTNAMFGPWLVIGHRFLDNLLRFKIRVPKEGLKGALLTLIWFWIPAHTITFALPSDWQITLAAVWSFVLGLILSLFVKKQDNNNI